MPSVCSLRFIHSYKFTLRLFYFWCLDKSVLSSHFLCAQGLEDESDAFDVSLTKNAQGLGITIAGYVGDKTSGEL